MIDIVERRLSSRSAIRHRLDTLLGKLGTANRTEMEADDPTAVQTAAAPLSLSTPYAGLASRGLALIIDILILAAILGSTTFIGNILIRELAFGDLTKQLLRGLLVLSDIAVPIAYFLVFWVLAGQTPGKAIMGLRIVTANRAPLTAGRAAIRLLGYVPSSLLLLGFLMVLVDPRRRALHDKLAGTVVIYASRHLSSTATQPPATQKEPLQ